MKFKVQLAKFFAVLMLFLPNWDTSEDLRKQNDLAVSLIRGSNPAKAVIILKAIEEKLQGLLGQVLWQRVQLWLQLLAYGCEKIQGAVF